MTDIAKQQRVVFWIIGVGLVVLLLVNALGWLYLQRIKSFFISDLKFRLENIANISAKLIDTADISFIVPGDQTSPEVIYYQSLLSEIKENNRLQEILILSPTLETLVNTIPDIPTDVSQRTPERSLVTRALAGESSTGQLQTLGDHKFLTAVTPLIDTDNVIVGLLIVEARADFFDMLDQFNQGLLIFSFLNSILILSVAFLLFRSIKRVFILQNLIKNQEHLVKLGEMAASVAHELRNPLGIMKGANSLIQKKYGTNKDEVFTYIPNELNRLNKLIEDFLTFARTKKVNIQNVNLNDLFTKLKVGYSEIPKLDISIDIPNTIPDIMSDVDALEQILLNIFKNSIQAMPKGGKISVKCELAGRGIQIHITDTGPEIPVEIMDRIFDPFFSTKEEGSGLGLAISRRLIDQISGDIYIRSSDAGGTTVSIDLPLNPK
jgi:signal transduction histidine kinase